MGGEWLAKTYHKGGQSNEKTNRIATETGYTYLISDSPVIYKYTLDTLHTPLSHTHTHISTHTHTHTSPHSDNNNTDSNIELFNETNPATTSLVLTDSVFAQPLAASMSRKTRELSIHAACLYDIRDSASFHADFHFAKHAESDSLSFSSRQDDDKQTNKTENQHNHVGQMYILCRNMVVVANILTGAPLLGI